MGKMMMIMMVMITIGTVGRLLCLKIKPRQAHMKQSKSMKQRKNQDDDDDVDVDPTEPNFRCDFCVKTMHLKHSFNIKGCPHFYCGKCIVKFVVSKLENNVTSIVCPVPDCRGVLDPEYCRPILPDKVFNWWGKALCEHAITESNNHEYKYFYCPFKDCSVLLIHDGPEDIKCCLCPHCKRNFCAKCKVPWHMEFDCVEFQKLSKNGEDNGSQMVMKLAAKKNWQRCPKCSYYVERSDGCNFMLCRCKTAFCYRCGTILDPRGNHYCPICKRTWG